jgi:D-alanyl-D-alanine carboxypeptidase
MIRIMKKEREWACLKAFYARMNETARELGLSKASNFAVAHGMHHDRNHSCAADMAKLSCVAMKHDLFRCVVNTKKFTCWSRISPDHKYMWKNTNQLLWDSSKQFHGVKTGITPTAGPCLSGHFKSPNSDFIVVVLNCKTKELRFSEIAKLSEWAENKIKLVKKVNYKPSLRKQLLKNLVHL